MSRVSDALRRAAEEPQPESAAKLYDHVVIDVVEEPFSAAAPVENLAFTGLKLTGGRSSPPLLMAASQDGAGAADLAADRSAPLAGAAGHASSDAPSQDPRAPTDWRALPAEVRRKRSGSFEDLIRDIARDEQRMNL